VTVGELWISLGLALDPSWRAGLAAVGALKVALEGIAGVVSGAADAGTHIAQLAASTGLSTAQVQEWGYVAEQAGGSADSFSRGVAQLDRFLRNFAAGGGSRGFASTMAQLGISVEDARAALADPQGLDRMLLRISDRFRTMGDTAERAAISRVAATRSR
jgi:hypothetical protein